MAANRVVVTDYTFPDVAQERAAAEGRGAAFAAHQCRSAEEVVEAVRDANIVAVQFAPFTREAVAVLAPGATVIRYGVGYDNIDLAAASEAGVKVGYVPDYCTDEVADHTAASVLTLLRKLMPLDASVRAGKWAAVATAQADQAILRDGDWLLRLWPDRTRRASAACSLRLPASRPSTRRFPRKTRRLRASRSARPDELFATCDLISLHAPANKMTTNFVNAERLRRCGRTR